MGRRGGNSINESGVIANRASRRRMAREKGKAGLKLVKGGTLEERNPNSPIMLTISILVSGREETTEKCIRSLDHLRQQVPCELILTDTGCSSKLRKWLEMKADKVLDFAWCNDFSAARNVGLQAASGQWFLFLDDDEWFEDTSQLELFFLSGEYRRYGSLFYIQRNYQDQEGTHWADMYVSRMVSLRKGTVFRYPIHEQLWPILEPVKTITDYVHHYGYTFTDKEEKREKNQRNLSLLLPLLEKEPDCTHHYIQTLVEYASMEQWEEAISMAELGLRNYVPGKADNDTHIQGVYGAAVQMRIQLAAVSQERNEEEDAVKKYAETVQRGEELMSTARLNDLCLARIHADLSIACGYMDRDRDCLEHVMAYLDKKAQFSGNRDLFVNQQSLILDTCFNAPAYCRAMVWGVKACFVLGLKAEREELLAREELGWWMEILPVCYKEMRKAQQEAWGAALERAATEDPSSYGARLFQALMYKGQAIDEMEEARKQQENQDLGQKSGNKKVSIAPTDEMKLLAVQLKSRIQQLREQDMKEEALSAVRQLLQYFPEDEELICWRKEMEGIALSISVLVSGRRESTEKCIASLEHLRTQVSCELILVDTGCPEEMRGWLERKADRILSFEWRDDFSAARNAGLEAATGRWFLFLDDDEWFENTAGLEDFFLSGEDQKYASASYIQRNYRNPEGTEWMDVALIRMVQRREDTRFIYPIHETLSPILKPVKELGDYVHHYGYADPDSEQGRKRSDRNLALLLSAIDKDPGCMNFRVQAVLAYASRGQWEKSLEMASEGVRSFDPAREDNGSHIQGLYAAPVKVWVRSAMSRTEAEKAAEDYAEALRLGKALLERERAGMLSTLARASICGDMTIACGALGQVLQCVECGQLYLEQKDYFDSHREAFAEQQTAILFACYETFQYRKVMGWYMAALLVLGCGMSGTGSGTGADTGVCFGPEYAWKLERLLARETNDWWKQTSHLWYKDAMEEDREKWKEAFSKCYEIAMRENHIRIKELYETLTTFAGKESTTVNTEMKNREKESLESDSAQASRNAAEMEALAVQLKSRIRLLIGGGMRRQALDAVLQMQHFFPGDQELARWREELEQEG